MEIMEVGVLDIYRGKKVFITGNTGFKGSWLTLMLQEAGAEITGYSLAPDTQPNHFALLNAGISTFIDDIRNGENLAAAVKASSPDIIFHLAAQPLVRASYTDPVNTYGTNVTGTLHLLEAARKCESVKAVVLITTDKVYENKETQKAYTETDELGGYDMYSSSKACCEILISSYRNSFLHPDLYKKDHHILIASARAGNVIGGGDWSADRLIPDMVKAAAKNDKVQIRNPQSVRPWQHVLDCLYGYLLLGSKLLKGEKAFAGPWNFSPSKTEIKNVEEITAVAKTQWNDISIEFGKPQQNFHEAGLLILDNSKAVTALGWKPAWDTITAVEKTIRWYRDYYLENKVTSMEQVREYLAEAGKK